MVVFVFTVSALVMAFSMLWASMELMRIREIMQDGN
jgi:cell division protein FtsL